MIHKVVLWRLILITLYMKVQFLPPREHRILELERWIRECEEEMEGLTSS
jgi:hypothetical protein